MERISKENTSCENKVSNLLYGTIQDVLFLIYKMSNNSKNIVNFVLLERINLQLSKIQKTLTHKGIVTYPSYSTGIPVLKNRLLIFGKYNEFDKFSLDSNKVYHVPVVNINLEEVLVLLHIELYK